MVEFANRKVAFRMKGGWLCLDFINTAGARRASTYQRDNLASYADLLAWGVQAGAITEQGALLLSREAARRPEEASAALKHSVVIRETLYRIFSAVAGARPPAKNDLAVFNTELSKAQAKSRIVRAAEGFAWSWAVDEGALDSVLWRVMRSAADLLTSGELPRVRQCLGQDCGWLFLDTSRNRSRRWCDMRDCGNLAKVRRYRERHRDG